MVFEDDLRRLEPFIGRDKTLRLWRAWQMEDSDGRRELEAILQVVIEKKMGITPLSSDQGLSMPQECDACGEFRIGDVVAGDRLLYPFGLREDEFIQHMAIFGRSGAGKTNTVALLIKELVRHGKPFMIFDWKRNYRDLLAGPDPVPLEVYTVGRPVRPLHFNPLIPPPGTDIKIWLKKLIEIISNAYYLGEGVIFMLLESLDHVYAQFGCYGPDPVTRYPTMHDVLACLQDMPVKGRKAMWMDSTLRAVQSLCFGQISDVINVARNDSLLDLLDKNVCLELNALGHSEKIFFIETLLVWIHHFRLLETQREKFKHCIIIEEAHNILSVSAKETVVDTLMREIRELGESIMLVDQHPSQISIPAMGNTYCTIALNMKHTKDIAALAEIMGIPRDYRDVLGQLAMGRAVVRLQARFTRPFQIQIPKVELDKGSVTDADLMQLYSADYSDSEADLDGTNPETANEDIPVEHKSNPDSLTELERLLINDIQDYPYDGVVRRYTRLGVSRRRGNSAKDRLIEHGLIQTVDIPTKTGKVVLLEFTPIMKKYLEEQGFEFPGIREGGLLHMYWKHEIQRILEQSGWTVEMEKPIGNGQTVDLEARKGEMVVAVEVETGARGFENIRKLLALPWAWIVSFSTDESVKSKTQSDLHKSDIHANHIRFATPGDVDQQIRSWG